MHWRSARRMGRTAAAVLAPLLLLLAGSAAGDDWGDTNAAEATAGDVEDHEGRSENPDGDVEGSEDPDAMTTRSETMGSREAGAGDPDADLATAERPAALLTGSESVTDLPTDRDESEFVSIEVPGQSQWAPTADPRIIAARNDLLRAQERARSAIDRYGEMRRLGEPRGDARRPIIEARDAAVKALEEAKQALAEAEGGA
jgi:hypothetical protein